MSIAENLGEMQMRNLALSLCLIAFLCQASWLPVIAQGDPVPGAPVNTPKVEIIEVPQNNGLINALQNFQFQQNQTNSIINSTAVKTNPTITPLDQRAGLTQKSTNINIFGINGLGINSGNNPFIVNSHLMAGGDLISISKDLASFLMRTDLNANKNDLFQKLNNTPTPALLGGLMMGLNLPSDLFNSIMNKAVQGGLEGLRSGLVELAIALKTGKISPADAQRVLMQMLGLAQPAKVAASVTPINTQTSSTVKTVTLSTTPVSTIQTVVANNNATPISTTNTNTKQPSAVPTVTIVSANSNTQTTGTANTQSTKVTQDQQKEILNDKKDKLEQTINTMQNVVTDINKDKQAAMGEKIGTSIGTLALNVVAPVTTPITVAVGASQTTGVTPKEAINNIGNAVMGMTGQGASLRAGEVKTIPPDPLQITQAAFLGTTFALKGLPPVLTSAIMLKAATGQFNNTTALATLNKVLSTPGLTKADAQSLVLSFLKATEKPGDLPVATLLNPGSTSSTTSTGNTAPTASSVSRGISASIATTSSTGNTGNVKESVASLIGSALGHSTNAAVAVNAVSNSNKTPAEKQAETKQFQAIKQQLDTLIDQALSNLSGATDRFNSSLDSIMNAMQDKSNTLNQIKFSN